MTVHEEGTKLYLTGMTATELLDVLDVVDDTRIGSDSVLRGYQHPRSEHGGELVLIFDSPVWVESFARRIRRTESLVVNAK